MLDYRGFRIVQKGPRYVATLGDYAQPEMEIAGISTSEVKDLIDDYVNTGQAGRRTNATFQEAAKGCRIPGRESSAESRAPSEKETCALNALSLMLDIQLLESLGQAVYDAGPSKEDRNTVIQTGNDIGFLLAELDTTGCLPIVDEISCETLNTLNAAIDAEDVLGAAYAARELRQELLAAIKNTYD